MEHSPSFSACSRFQLPGSGMGGGAIDCAAGGAAGGSAAPAASPPDTKGGGGKSSAIVAHVSKKVSPKGQAPRAFFFRAHTHAHAHAHALVSLLNSRRHSVQSAVCKRQATPHAEALCCWCVPQRTSCTARSTCCGQKRTLTVLVHCSPTGVRIHENGALVTKDNGAHAAPGRTVGFHCDLAWRVCQRIHKCGQQCQKKQGWDPPFPSTRFRRLFHSAVVSPAHPTPIHSATLTVGRTSAHGSRRPRSA